MTNFNWIDLSSYSDGDGPGASLGALITLPAIVVDGHRLTQQRGWNPTGWISFNMSLATIVAEVGKSSTSIGFTIRQYGYGYGYRGSYTVVFALAVLLAHAVVTIGYIFYSIYH